MAPRRREGRGNPKKNKDRKKRKTFQIRIKTLSGIVRELEVHADMRVYELKERTMDKLGFQLDKQILIFGHEKLETPRKLSDYNISNGSELRLVVDLEGMARRGDLTDDDVPRDQPDRRVARRFLRRVCDNCGRQGTLKEPRFPVCYCGARRYCDERCQHADWRRGHSRRCASGHAFTEDVLNCIELLKFNHEDGACTDDEYELALQAIFDDIPPPDDRER
jgi:hypothetical protein